MRRGEHAPHELDRGHREVDPRNISAQSQLLLDLGGVTVPDRPERAHHTRPLRMVAILARLASALARADLALDNDGPRTVDHARPEERKERENRRGRIAARAGDPRRGADLIPVELRDAVCPSLKPRRPRVGRAVPAVVGRRIAQPVIARQIDQNRAAVLKLVRAMRAVRQREKEDVAFAHVLVVHEGKARAFAEVRVRGAHRLSGERLAAGDDLVDLRMGQQQAQQLAARIPGGTDHSHLHRAALATSRT